MSSQAVTRQILFLFVAVTALATFAIALPSPASAGPENRAQDFIVFLDDDVDSATAARFAKRAHGAAVGHVYEHAVQGYAARMSPVAAEKLRNRAGVASVIVDREVSIAAPSWCTNPNHKKYDPTNPACGPQPTPTPAPTATPVPTPPPGPTPPPPPGPTPPHRWGRSRARRRRHRDHRHRRFQSSGPECCWWLQLQQGPIQQLRRRQRSRHPRRRHCRRDRQQLRRRRGCPRCSNLGSQSPRSQWFRPPLRRHLWNRLGRFNGQHDRSCKHEPGRGRQCRFLQ